MKYYLVFMSVVLSGCGATQIKPESEGVLATGTWKGVLDTVTTKRLPDQTGNEVFEVVVLACNQNYEFLLKVGGTKYHQISSDYKIEHLSDSAQYHTIYKGEGWVESQYWSLVSINGNRASIQWSRMVSNPNFSDVDEFRSYGQLGYGELNKISATCDLFNKDVK